MDREFVPTANCSPASPFVRCSYRAQSNETYRYGRVYLRTVDIGVTVIAHDYHTIRLTHVNKLRPGPRLNINTVCPGMEISIIKIKRSWDRLIFIREIHIPVRHLCIEAGSRWSWLQQNAYLLTAISLIDAQYHRCNLKPDNCAVTSDTGGLHNDAFGVMATSGAKVTLTHWPLGDFHLILGR